jgi:hypothetical protein
MNKIVFPGSISYWETETADPSASLGMTKGRTALPFGMVHPTGDAEANCYCPLCHPEPDDLAFGEVMKPMNRAWFDRFYDGRALFSEVSRLRIGTFYSPYPSLAPGL